MIRHLDYVQVVLDDQDRVAGGDQAVQGLQQRLDIVEVKPGGGLIQQVEGLARGGSVQLRGQLDALGLASREGGRGLAQLDVPHSDPLEGGEDSVDLPVVGKEGRGLRDGHLQDVGDGLPAVADLQGFCVEASPLAGLAGDLHVREQLHLHSLCAGARALLAPAPGNVEGESAGLVATGTGLGHPGKQGANPVEGSGVGSGIGAGCSTDGGLVNDDDLVDGFRSLKTGQLRSLSGSLGLTQGLVEHLHHQGGLPRSGHAGEYSEHPQGQVYVDRLQVVGVGSTDLQELAVAGSAHLGHRNERLSPQVGAGQGPRFAYLGGSARSHHPAAFHPGPRAYVHDPVRSLNGGFVVLDDKHRVAAVPEVHQGVQELLVVSGVEPN